MSLIRDGFLWPGRDAPLIVHSLCSVRSVWEDCSRSGAWWWHAVSFPTAISLPQPSADTDRDPAAAAPARGGTDDGSHCPTWCARPRDTKRSWAPSTTQQERLVSVHGAWKASIADPNKKLHWCISCTFGEVMQSQFAFDWPAESHNPPQGPAGYSYSQCFMSAFCIYSPIYTLRCNFLLV